MTNTIHRLFVGALLAAPFFACTAHADTPPFDAQAVIASQGGAKVTFADIDTFVERMPMTDRAPFFNSPKRIESVISNLLVQKQLAAEARAQGLDKDPDILKQKGGATDLALSAAEMAHLRAGLKMPDFSELAQEEYIANKEKYSVPGILDVKHVLVSTQSRSEEDAKALADQVEAEARKDPSQFDALVAKYSDDPNKSSHQGLITHAGGDRYEATFAAAAKALAKPGDISPVVKTSYGFHVLKLVAKAPVQPKAFNEVRDQIITTLRSNYVEKSMKEHVDILRNKPIDANPDYVASLRTRYGVAPTPPGKEPTRSAKP
ncbi:peptidylprolyl isomerase [Dokdonella soli]|uniref:peptidylprolyl isomerase n=1 Tax=Dokdonella soli TaxID=529810 RepID=A0ABP3TR65_9GAMM